MYYGFEGWNRPPGGRPEAGSKEVRKRSKRVRPLDSHNKSDPASGLHVLDVPGCLAITLITIKSMTMPSPLFFSYFPTRSMLLLIFSAIFLRTHSTYSSPNPHILGAYLFMLTKVRDLNSYNRLNTINCLGVRDQVIRLIDQIKLESSDLVFFKCLGSTLICINTRT